MNFKEICSFENLYSAYLRSRKGKRHRKEILRYSYDLEKNLIELQEELLSQKYTHGNYREFILYDSKKRRIMVAPFKDRIVHNALHNAAEPVFEKGFVYDSYACRKEKGTHKAIKRLEKFLKSISDSPNFGGLNARIYCLKCDVFKYFDSIDHEVLLNIIKRKITDKGVFGLVEKIVRSNQRNPGKGIPIGNLTSQLFANIYLNELDRFAKHKLKTKYYIRYMDDFLLLDTDKKKLQQVKNRIKEFLNNKLKLKLHPKKANVFPIDKGIDFLGYVIHGKYRLLRKSTVKRFLKRTKKQIKEIESGDKERKELFKSIESFMAYTKHGNSWKLRKNILAILCARVNLSISTCL